MKNIFSTHAKLELISNSISEGLIEKCPNCLALKIGVIVVSRFNSRAFLLCKGCMKPFLVDDLPNRNLLVNSSLSVITIPDVISEFNDMVKFVPSEFHSTLKQAIKCYELNCYDASVTMSRRVIQEITRSTLSKNGFKVGSNKLYDELLKLKVEKLILPKSYNMCINIKNIANFGAHPDEIDPSMIATEEDSRMALNVISLLVKEIYESDVIYNSIENNSKVKKKDVK